MVRLVLTFVLLRVGYYNVGLSWFGVNEESYRAFHDEESLKSGFGGSGMRVLAMHFRYYRLYEGVLRLFPWCLLVLGGVFPFMRVM